MENSTHTTIQTQSLLEPSEFPSHCVWFFTNKNLESPASSAPVENIAISENSSPSFLSLFSDFDAFFCAASMAIPRQYNGQHNRAVLRIGNRPSCSAVCRGQASTNESMEDRVGMIEWDECHYEYWSHCSDGGLLIRLVGWIYV